MRQTDPDPAAFDSYDCTPGQVAFVLSNNARTNWGLLEVAKVDEADDSGVDGSEGNRKLAEILVERHQHLTALCSVGKNLVVTRVAAPVSNPLHLVPGPLKLCLCPGPHAAIEQKLQAASSVMAGSIRSWPTTRRA